LLGTRKWSLPSELTITREKEREEEGIEGREEEWKRVKRNGREGSRMEEIEVEWKGGKRNGG
jgi:hypothetical protein